jgi:hypothetical protein
LARFGFAQRGSTSRQSRHERGRQCLTSHRHHKDILSSTERSTDAYAKSVNESRDEGELARCLDVAATRAGRATVMDRGSGRRQPKI